MAANTSKSGTAISQDAEIFCPETSVSGSEFLVPPSSSNSESEFVLAEIIARTIVPELLVRNKDLLITQSDERGHPTEADIQKLSSLILGPDNSDALEYINALREKGLTLDNLYLELLEPTARYLGELWIVDKIDFFAVTIGVGRMQRIVHHFADLDKLGPYDEKRRALMLVPPGEDHTFGSQLVQRFLRAADWSVVALDGSETRKAADVVSREWVVVVGISISADVDVDDMRQMIKSIRSRSLNPHIGIMIGGPKIALSPDLVDEVGADGQAQNAPAAVLLAETMLARGLEAARLSRS
jgi:methanogenic corrinoid protein MtbC1